MNKIQTAGQTLETRIGAIKKVVANLLGIKRLRFGANFVEDADTAALFIGKRQHNMGDLWREPMGNPVIGEDIPSQLELFDAPPNEIASSILNRPGFAGGSFS